MNEAGRTDWKTGPNDWAGNWVTEYIVNIQLAPGYIYI